MLKEVVNCGRKIIDALLNPVKENEKQKKNNVQSKKKHRFRRWNITTRTLSSEVEKKSFWIKFSYEMASQKLYVPGKYVIVYRKFGASEMKDFKGLPADTLRNIIFRDVSSFKNCTEEFWETHGCALETITFIGCRITGSLIRDIQQHCYNLIELCCVQCNYGDESLWKPTDALQRERYKDYKNFSESEGTDWVQESVAKLFITPSVKYMMTRIWEEGTGHMYHKQGNVMNFLLDFETGIKYLCLRQWNTQAEILSLYTERAFPKLNPAWTGWPTFRNERHPLEESKEAQWCTLKLDDDDKKWRSVLVVKKPKLTSPFLIFEKSRIFRETNEDDNNEVGTEVDKEDKDGE